MVSSIEVIDYFFKIKVGNYVVCVTIHTFYTIGSLEGFRRSLRIALFDSYR